MMLESEPISKQRLASLRYKSAEFQRKLSISHHNGLCAAQLSNTSATASFHDVPKSAGFVVNRSFTCESKAGSLTRALTNRRRCRRTDAVVTGRAGCRAAMWSTTARTTCLWRASTCVPPRAVRTLLTKLTCSASPPESDTATPYLLRQYSNAQSSECNGTVPCGVTRCLATVPAEPT